MDLNNVTNDSINEGLEQIMDSAKNNYRSLDEADDLSMDEINSLCSSLDESLEQKINL